MFHRAESAIRTTRLLLPGGMCRQIFCFVAFAVALADGQTPVVKPGYYHPPDDTDGSLATISGDLLTLYKLIAYPSIIDGLRVENAASFGRRRLPLRAASHVIVVEIGIQGSTDTYARANLRLDAHPGANYAIRFSSEFVKVGGPTFFDFWIIDTKTGAVASSTVRANIIKKLPI